MEAKRAVRVYQTQEMKGNEGTGDLGGQDAKSGRYSSRIALQPSREKGFFADVTGLIHQMRAPKSYLAANPSWSKVNEPKHCPRCYEGKKPSVMPSTTAGQHPTTGKASSKAFLTWGSTPPS